MFVDQTSQQNRQLVTPQMQHIEPLQTRCVPVVETIVPRDTMYPNLFELFMTAAGDRERPSTAVRNMMRSLHARDYDAFSSEDECFAQAHVVLDHFRADELAAKAAAKPTYNIPALVAKLQDAWHESPELLLKVIAHTRDPRNGKGERDIAFALMRWLKENKNATYRKNIARLAGEYGRWNDLNVMSLNESGDVDAFEMSVFADQLRADLLVEKPSLAAKWAPREHGASRKNALALANVMFPDDAHALKRYRTEVIAPLMGKLNVVEVLMCSKRFCEIDYEKLPANAMLLYGRDRAKMPQTDGKFHHGAFLRRDRGRYIKYYEDARDRKFTISTAKIKPHKLVSLVKRGCNALAEQQWNKMIVMLRDSCKIASAISVVDVSMTRSSSEISTAFGLMTGELTVGTFHNKVISYSDHPQIFDISAMTLYDQVKKIQRIERGKTIDLQAVYRLILNSAMISGTSREHMPNVIYVLTDNHFETILGSREWVALYNSFVVEFETAGYNVPQMVFWNLRGSKKNELPSIKTLRGITIVTGFSNVLMKAFMGGAELDSMSILQTMLDQYIVEVDPNDLC